MRTVGQFLRAIIVSLPLCLMPVLRPLNLIAADSEPTALRCLALTVYWEARADGRKAMEAVGWVVLNRVKNPDFPDSVCQVVREGGEKSPCQFSYWCDGQPDEPKNEDAWAEAREVAARLLNKPSADPTGGALFYHAVGVTPNWAREHKRTVIIGRHVFYR